MRERWISNGLKRGAVAWFETFFIFLEGLRKSMKIPWNNQSVVWELSPGHSEYKAGMLTTQTLFSLVTIFFYIIFLSQFPKRTRTFLKPTFAHHLRSEAFSDSKNWRLFHLNCFISVFKSYYITLHLRARKYLNPPPFPSVQPMNARVCCAILFATLQNFSVTLKFFDDVLPQNYFSGCLCPMCHSVFGAHCNGYIHAHRQNLWYVIWHNPSYFLIWLCTKGDGYKNEERGLEERLIQS